MQYASKGFQMEIKHEKIILLFTKRNNFRFDALVKKWQAKKKLAKKDWLSDIPILNLKILVKNEYKQNVP